MLYSINWPNFIVWLSLHLEILGNMCIAIVCFPSYIVTSWTFKLTIYIWSSQFSRWPKIQDRNLNILLIFNLKIHNKLKLSCWPLAFTSYKAFYKEKRSLKLVFLPHFLHECWRKIFLALNCINWPYFTAWLSLPVEILDSMCIVIICCSVRDVINFEVNLSFLIKLFFCITKKS